MFSRRFPRGPLTPPPPNSHNSSSRPWIHLRMHVNKRVYLYVYSRSVYTCTISMCNNIDPEGSILDVFFSFGFVGIRAAANESPDRRENYFRQYKITILKIIIASCT